MKPYGIIKGGSANPYSPLQRGGGRGIKNPKELPYVIHDRIALRKIGNGDNSTKLKMVLINKLI